MFPLIHQGQFIGALSADNKSSKRPIIEEELGPVTFFASHAAAAIMNARLFEQLESLRRTTLELTSLSGREELLHTIIERAVALLEPKAVGYSSTTIREGAGDYCRP